jgi:hypothetical protein
MTARADSSTRPNRAALNDAIRDTVWPVFRLKLGRLGPGPNPTHGQLIDKAAPPTTGRIASSKLTGETGPARRTQ